MAKKNGQITERELMSLFTRLRNKQKEAEEAAAEAESLKMELEALIPAGESCAGISHTVTFGKAVSYAQALAVLREEVIPKTKAAQVEQILGRFTKPVARHTLRMEAP